MKPSLWNRPLTVLRGAAVLIALLGIGLLLRAQLQLGVPSADASGMYTDHLRHMGEAAILQHQGYALYRQPYGTLIAQEPNIGPEHVGLFPERTAPYPPLGILLHLPWEKLEQSGSLSPASTHRAVVWMWTLVALAACAVVLRLFAPLAGIAQVWAAGIAVPLLIGMGVNGFFDCGYLVAGALACLCWRHERRVAALWCLAFAAALHFRAAVFAPLAAVILWELREKRQQLGLGALSALIVIPSALAAIALDGTLGTIPADNPVHFSHLKLSLVLFTLGSSVVAVGLWLQRERLVAVTVLTAFALALFERSHGWWHAGTLLAPGLVFAARPARVSWLWPVLLAWTLASAYLGFRHGASPFWQWVAFGFNAQAG